MKVTRPAGQGNPLVTRRYPRSELGYTVDVDATVEQILERGRQGNPLAALADQLSASLGTIEMDPIVTFDDERFERWLGKVERDLATSSSEGGLRFAGSRVIVQLPRAGLAIDDDELATVATEVILDDDELSLEVPVETLEPEMTPGQVRAAERRANEILAASIILRSGPDRSVIPPSQFGRALVSRNVEGSDGVEIRFSVNAKKLRREAASALDRLTEEPEDASFTLGSSGVRVIPGRPGTAVDTKKLASSLLDIASSKDRTAPAPIQKVWPEFSTKDARALHIEEQVSSFTTYHSCCEPRVDNIHRIADIIDGTIVKPGEEFSLNGTVGERTTAKGFVGAPAINNGEYVEEVGGGISQFATTIFNATFFGGYDFLEYKTHSYYISRYPMGREATVSWPSPDFKFLNDSDSGIYIDTSYSETSITVTFYGRKERSVRSVSGEPHDYTSPPRQCKENRSLGRGESRVIQTGSRGFDITVTRVFGNGDREDFDTIYLPVPEIVEKRKCK